MPATSKKQYKFMQAHASTVNKAIGPSAKVAKEFIDKTPDKKKKLWSK